MRIGDRVKYIREARPNLEGRNGTILDFEPNENVRVKFDAINYPEGHTLAYVESVIQVVSASTLKRIGTPIMTKDEESNTIPLVTEEHNGVHYQVNPNKVKMTKFRVGDRVKHIGEARIGFGNREGIVLKVEPDGDYKVELESANFTDIDGVPTCLPSKIIHVSEYHLELASPAIKDSGDRTKYPSGAVRDKRVGKGMYSLIPSHSLERIAKHYEAGRVKYSDADNPKMAEENWKKGMYLIDFYDSARRHIESWKMGRYDEDHLAAACWNLLNLMETERRIQLGIYSLVLDNRDPIEFDNPRDLYDSEPHSLRIVTGEVCKVKENNGN